MNNLACVQSAALERFRWLLNDSELTNSLTDALFRSKIRRVDVMLSTVLRMLLWQKNLTQTGSNTIDIDYSDSRDVQQFYALELAIFAKTRPKQMLTDTHMISKDLDDLIKIRLNYIIPSITSSTYVEDRSNMDESEYFHRILQINRPFGCTSGESCCNETATFKRHFDEIVQQATKINQAYANNPHIDLKQFSYEISYVNDLFSRLLNEIQ